jgi:ABC-type transport system substrate-binding protein
VVRGGGVSQRLVALTVVLALAACGGSGGRGGVGPRAATTGTGPVRGGVLRIGLAPPRSLDPLRATSAGEVVLADLLFDGLTRADPRTGGVRPGLAERWESDDGQRRFTFHLRRGARFADGTPVTAADAAFSIERARAPGSGVGELLAGPLGLVSSVSAPDPATVVVTLSEPFPDLPALFANPALGVVPRAVGAAPGFAEQPVGSGPFALAAREGGVLRLRRSPGSEALLDGIEVRTGDGPSLASAFAGGELDWALFPADRAPDLASSLRAERGRPAYAPLGGVLFYGMNLRDPKFADRRFREAIVRAVDRAGIAERVYRGTVRPIDGPVPRGVPGAVPDACGDRCRHDPVRARALVAEAFPGGAPAVTVDTDDDPIQREVAAAIAADLRAVGIEATVRAHAADEYVALVARGGQGVFRLGWAAGYASADAFLRPLFQSGSDTNVTGFSSPALDGALAAARTDPDPAARAARLAEAQRLVMAEVPIVPIAQFETLAFASPRVRGLHLDVIGGFDGSTVWLAAP